MPPCLLGNWLSSLLVVGLWALGTLRWIGKGTFEGSHTGAVLHPIGRLSLPGFHLCSATLQWLLAENAAAAVVRAQTLSSIQGVAPDGTDVNLIVREASRGHFRVLGMGLRALSPPWVPGPSLMESYSHLPLSLVCPTKTGSLGGPALSNPSRAPLGSQWAISTVLLVDHPKPVAAHLLDHQRVMGPFEGPQVRQPIPSGLSFSDTLFLGSS